MNEARRNLWTLVAGLVAGACVDTKPVEQEQEATRVWDGHVTGIYTEMGHLADETDAGDSIFVRMIIDFDRDWSVAIWDGKVEAGTSDNCRLEFLGNDHPTCRWLAFASPEVLNLSLDNEENETHRMYGYFWFPHQLGACHFRGRAYDDDGTEKWFTDMLCDTEWFGVPSDPKPVYAVDFEVDLPRFRGRLVVWVDGVWCGFFFLPSFAGEGQRATRTMRAFRRSLESFGRPVAAGSLQAAWLSFSKLAGDS